MKIELGHLVGELKIKLVHLVGDELMRPTLAIMQRQCERSSE